MIQIIRNLLSQKLNDIDTGNSNISESEQQELLELLQKITSKKLPTIQAANYMGVCRSTFENYIDKGLIPKGIKEQGVHSLFWYKCDLDKCKQQLKLKKHDKTKK